MDDTVKTYKQEKSRGTFIPASTPTSPIHTLTTPISPVSFLHWVNPDTRSRDASTTASTPTGHTY